MRRRESNPIIFEKVGEMIGNSIEIGWNSFRIPDPIYEVPDFPAIRPIQASTLKRQALGLHAIDKTGFNLRFENSILRTYKKNYAQFDHEERLEIWMSQNVAFLADQIVTEMGTQWVDLSLDEKHPDTDRWYLGFCLLAGRALQGSESVLKSESIPLSLAFGIPSDSRKFDFPHPKGMMALTSLLNAAEGKVSSLLHNSWLPILAVYESSSVVMDVSKIATACIHNHPESDNSGCMSAIIQVMAYDMASATRNLISLVDNGTQSTHTLLCDNLDPILGRSQPLALQLLKGMVLNKNEAILPMLASKLYPICRHDQDTYTRMALEIIQSGNDKAIRSLIEYGFRQYLQDNPDDTGMLLSTAWKFGGDISKSRLRGLIVLQKKKSDLYFEKTVSEIESFSKSEADQLRLDVSARSGE